LHPHRRERAVGDGGFGLIGDLIVGLIGAFTGDWPLPARHSFRHRNNRVNHQCLYRCSGAAAHSAPREPKQTAIGLPLAANISPRRLLPALHLSSPEITVSPLPSSESRAKLLVTIANSIFSDYRRSTVELGPVKFAERVE
jgi:hypothetical protein